MRNHARWLALTLVASLALFCLLAPAPASAQDQNEDPPQRAARLSFIGGAVSFQPAGTDDWVDAVPNRPMTTGDKLWADRNSRAEVRVDAYALRLGSQTGFSFLNLDDSTVQVRLTEGVLNLRVRRLDDNQTLEIDTPNLAFNVLRPGSYRLDVNENGDATIVTVRDGQGEVTGGGSAYPVHAGDSVTFSGTDSLNADVEGVPEEDDFDQWNYDRDERWEHSVSPRYVSDDVVGYEDLDENGGWRQVPDYGTVWFPHTTIVGWAPYRYGHWVWVAPWGWTWVDDAPWGFAPFHYGRWVVVGGVWGWVPSPPRPAVVSVAYVRPVYAPALVAWVGGPGFAVGVGVGAGVAWFPLGPRDVFCPTYHVSQVYVERVNVSNTVIINRTQVTNVYTNVYVNKNVTNITYQNQRVANAVTATTQANFSSAQPVGRNMIKVDANAVATAHAAPFTPSVAPQQRSFLGAGATARVAPPAAALARPVVAKTAPPPAPISAARQIQAVQSNGGRPLAVAQVRQEQTRASARPAVAVRVAPAAKPAQLPARGAAPNNARSAAGNRQQAQPNANRPPQQAQPAEPNVNRSANSPPANSNVPKNDRSMNDRPPTARPQVDPQTQQRQQQQIQQLRQQQDQERQQVEQQHVQQQQKLQQQKANEQKQQQLQRQQQQQLEQMEKKHDQQEQNLKQQQQKENQKPNNKQEKPEKKDNKDKEKPH